jgi:transposase
MSRGLSLSWCGRVLKAITGSYVSGLGQPPFDPRMMVALLLHGYASGLYSSRWIAKACREPNDFVMIVALDPPDFRTISDFRKRHLKALGALFLQSCARRQDWSNSAMSRLMARRSKPMRRNIKR